jgi:hypothetical protein
MQPSRFRQYEFEMDHSTGGTVHGMLRWQYGRPNCFEARYEDLRRDTRLTQWLQIAAFLGFDEAGQQACRQRFWENSLFGGLSRIGNKHVRSGDVAQWKRVFTVELACAFLSRFPAVLQKLGYEEDHSWILELQRKGAHQSTPLLKRIAHYPPEPVRRLAASLLSL